MTEPIVVFQGSGRTGSHGRMELYEDRVMIIKSKEKGMLRAALGQTGAASGDRTVFIDQISSVEVYPGGFIDPGYIRIIISGASVEAKYDSRNATKDPNAISFTKKEDAQLANQFKDKVEELRATSRKGVAPQMQASPADELRKYKQLLDDGIITESEFSAKKKELLGF